MKSYQFAFICVLYTGLLLSHLQAGEDAQNDGADPNCDTHKTFDDFYMKLEVCRPNISVSCLTRPKTQCSKNQAVLKAIAHVTDHVGQCLIEANVTEHRTLRFYIEAKRVLNPNQEGSRSLSGGERHQRGKCILKYVCNQKSLTSMSMDCGAVIVGNEGKMQNFTRRKAYWLAPANYSDMVVFGAKIEVTPDMRELNVPSTRIFVPGVYQKEHRDGGPKQEPKIAATGAKSPSHNNTQVPEDFSKSSDQGSEKSSEKPSAPSPPNEKGKESSPETGKSKGGNLGVFSL